MQNTASFLRNIKEVKRLAGLIETDKSAAEPPRPSPFSISFGIDGKPPSQFVAVKATERVRVTKIEYMLSSEACIESKDIEFEGKAIEAPIDHESLTKLLKLPARIWFPTTCQVL